MAALSPGDQAPAFTLDDQTGSPVSLRDFAPGRVIVYFYPAALTPGCTTEAIDFSARLGDFARAGVRIVGISPDRVARLAEFTTKHDLRVTLLADPARTTIDAYGAWGTKVLYGKPVEGVIRSTVVVDVDSSGAGTVVWAEYNVRATGHVDRLMRQLLPA
ncbi:MAG: peroxiredoxin [Actinomycetia bacterium]|nr:peroxiredoxin [Actinomycetes bacterium]